MNFASIYSIKTRDQISFAEQSHLIKRFNEVGDFIFDPKGIK